MGFGFDFGGFGVQARSRTATFPWRIAAPRQAVPSLRGIFYPGPAREDLVWGVLHVAGMAMIIPGCSRW